MTTPAPWTHRRQRKPAATFRLYCFPYAGGHSGTYRPWDAYLPPEIELHTVQLPGRLQRLQESPLESVADIVGQCTPELLSSSEDRPYALFGHSMGALLAFEVAHAMTALGRPPRQLFVSGRRAPQLRSLQAPTHDLGPEDFLLLLRQLGGTPEAILANAELMQMVLPTLRADFKAVETYSCPQRPRLPCRIAAFGGSSDARVSVDELQAWQEHTAERVILTMFAGGHFFVEDEGPAIVRTITTELAHARATPTL